MKKLLAFFMITVMCLTFTACQKSNQDIHTDYTPSNITEGKACTEQELRLLLENNFDCYYLFYSLPLAPTGEADEDGYYKAQTNFFQKYSELEAFVTRAYTDEISQKLLSYPNSDAPLYKNVDDTIYVKPDAIEPVNYEVIWDDTYSIEFTENSPTKCSFVLTTTDFDSNEYTTQGSAVHQGDSWVLLDVVY